MLSWIKIDSFVCSESLIQVLQILLYLKIIFLEAFLLRAISFLKLINKKILDMILHLKEIIIWCTNILLKSSRLFMEIVKDSSPQKKNEDELCTQT